MFYHYMNYKKRNLQHFSIAVYFFSCVFMSQQYGDFPALLEQENLGCPSKYFFLAQTGSRTTDVPLASLITSSVPGEIRAHSDEGVEVSTTDAVV
jgi:hypothetical protein